MHMRRFRPAVILPALLGLSLLAAAPASWAEEDGLPEVPQTQSNDWVLEAPSPDERFQRLQMQLRGFDAAMFEVGQRFQATYEAVQDGNLELARYQWEHIGLVIRFAHMRRPARRENAEKLFLQGLWPEVDRAFAGTDQPAAAAAFARAREACMACHVAEHVPFMNDQAMFRRTAQPPVRR